MPEKTFPLRQYFQFSQTNYTAQNKPQMNLLINQKLKIPLQLTYAFLLGSHKNLNPRFCKYMKTLNDRE